MAYYLINESDSPFMFTVYNKDGKPVRSFRYIEPAQDFARRLTRAETGERVELVA